MKITKANVSKWATERGLIPVQLDGIPEGFSFKENDLTVGNVTNYGQYIAYVPLSDWETIYANSTKSLQDQYKKYVK